MMKDKYHEIYVERLPYSDFFFFSFVLVHFFFGWILIVALRNSIIRYEILVNVMIGSNMKTSLKIISFANFNVCGTNVRFKATGK